jgi:2-C-methyl-D-erythritol 2,4-cyclodiphosphate synthase
MVFGKIQPKTAAMHSVGCRNGLLERGVMDDSHGCGMRVGMGVDFHRLVPNRPLILGGVGVPHQRGLAGHSDADVLLHAVCDALLGAAGMGDIGRHFPDSDPRYHNVSSMTLLRKVAGMLSENLWRVVNIDATVIAQAPKLSGYGDEICRNIAAAVEIDRECVNFKATTTEALGAVGRREGIGAMATALIRKER